MPDQQEKPFYQRILERIRSDNEHLIKTNPEIAAVTTTITWNLPQQVGDSLPSNVVTTPNNKITSEHLYQTLRQIVKLGHELHNMAEQFAAQVTRQGAAKPAAAQPTVQPAAVNTAASADQGKQEQK
jgi:hypothetical protein